MQSHCPSNWVSIQRRFRSLDSMIPSTMTSMTFEEARQLLDDPHSCFKLIRTQKHMTVSPKYVGRLKAGIAAQLDAQTKLFDERLGGVLVAYQNIKCLQKFGKMLRSQAWIHLNIEADFIVFKPYIGSILKGMVNKLGKDYVGCLVHGCYNASISKPRACGREWLGGMLKMGEVFLFEVVNLYPHNTMMSIKGQMTSDSFLTNDLETRMKRKASESVYEEAENDFLDSLCNEDIDMPDILPKKRRKKEDIAGLDVVLEDKDQSSSESSKRKKKKKEKRKHDEIASPSASLPADLSNHLGTSSKKKKRKKDKHVMEESMDLLSSDISAIASDMTMNADVPTTKKKKKKNKHVMEGSTDLLGSDVLPIASNNTMLANVPSSNKKKKKKDKHVIKEPSNLMSDNMSDIASSGVKHDASAKKKKKKKDKLGSKKSSDLLKSNFSVIAGENVLHGLQNKLAGTSKKKKKCKVANGNDSLNSLDLSSLSMPMDDPALPSEAEEGATSMDPLPFMPELLSSVASTPEQSKEGSKLKRKKKTKSQVESPGLYHDSVFASPALKLAGKARKSSSHSSTSSSLSKDSGISSMEKSPDLFARTDKLKTVLAEFSDDQDFQEQDKFLVSAAGSSSKKKHKLKKSKKKKVPTATLR